MSARDAILAAVRAARPPSVARPESLRPVHQEESGLSRLDAFTAAATAAGATVTLAPRKDVPRFVASATEGAITLLSFAAGVTSTMSPHGDAHSLSALDVLVSESSLGVAENGAVWIATSDTVLRGALFLAARVVIVVREEDLVDDLHQAYERIDVRSHSFGVFVSGPSKTADIEQSLVIGAHGPKALTLVVVRADEPVNP
ncbi:MAG TPA: LUD domain-containing protein [Gemmatimonadaceae bacterium]|nr:LUD domain-containing protein [Gemmatimonadaceae bacterium]